MLNFLSISSNFYKAIYSNLSALCSKISILKLDTNLYEGTKIELEVLFPKVQTGGFIIVDNYTNYKGIQKAVNEFFANDNSSIIKYHPILSRIVILITYYIKFVVITLFTGSLAFIKGSINVIEF